MTKLQNNKGFTLVELLIVIAIIAILAAVALPVYSAQMESAREAVDAGTVRSAASLAQSDYLLGGYTNPVDYMIVTKTVGDVENVFVVSSESTLVTGDEGFVATYAAGAHDWSPVSKKYQDASADTTLVLTVANGGQVTSSSWPSTT